MNTIFAPHGEFKLCVSNNILIARLTGTWNEECAKDFSEQFKEQVHLLQKPRWGHLVFLDDWELSIPEVLPIVTDLVTFCINNGLEKSAQVYSESMIKKLFLDKMIVEKKGDFERRIFIKQNEAINWLNQNGFTLVEGIVATEVV